LKFNRRYKRYDTQLEATKSTNREAESDFVAEVGGMNHIEPGSEWERVSKHCDFSAKVGRLASRVGIWLNILFAGTWSHQGCVSYEIHSPATQAISSTN
jgi:hypothetical protein